MTARPEPDAAAPGEAVGGFLHAGRVALIGASSGRRDEWSYNARMTRSLLASSFDEVVLVSRHDDRIAGHRAYPSLGDHPGPAGDVCVLVVPRAGLGAAVDDARAAGWPRLLIITGQLTDGDRAMLRAAVPDVRIWGPNCTGMIAAASNSRIVASDYELAIRPGRARVAVAGQSGGALNGIASSVEHLGLNVSHLLSTGEEVDVGVDDVLWYAAGSGATDGVVLFVEEARRPERFLGAVSACQAASMPVVVVKVGHGRTAAVAARTHSGALVGDWDDFEAAVTARGAAVCTSLREGGGVAAVWAALGRRPGRRVAFFTSSGGSGALACDVADSCGLAMAELSASGTARLEDLAQSRADAVNPFDSANGGGTPSTLPAYLETLATEPDVDALVLLHSGEVYGELIVDRVTTPPGPPKPLVTVWPATPRLLRDRLLDAGIPVLDDLGDACRWLAIVAGGADARSPGERGGADASDAGWLTYGEAMELVAGGGIDVPRRALVRGAAEIAAGLAAFDAAGQPVVVKAAGLRGHKARAGGVVGDLRDRAELARALGDLTARFGAVAIEEQVPAGVELLVAVRRGRFGGVIVVGLGGRHADVFGRQVVVRRGAPAPEVRAALAPSPVGRLLASDLGAAAGPALDTLAATACRLDQIAAACRLDVLEVNPVIVTAERAVACDAKAQREGEG
jgi:acyl-CoA synthetase (NDP forming)